MSLPNQGRGFRCHRIERSVAEVMECELLPSLDDPALNDLHVFSVEVTNNLACVRVTLCPGTGGVSRNAEDVNAALNRVENRLRLELAASIRMKRMPVLRLSYVPLAVWAQPGGAE